jgi:fibronectin-binding autotransporter adhesin
MKTLTLTLLSLALLAIGLTNVQAQPYTANWIGPTNGDWNTDANWDTGLAPADATTNAIIGPTNILTYNSPMVAAGFGVLTNWGVLSINASGFNNNGIFMLYPGGTGKLYVNSGGIVNVTGNIGMMSNSVINMAAGSSVTLSGTLYIGSGATGGSGTGTANSLASMTNNSGILSAAGVSLNAANGSVGNGSANLFVINGGTNNLGNVYVGRASGSTQVAQGREGLVINGGIVNMTSMAVGQNAWGAMIINSGTITNTGNGRMWMRDTAGRPSRMYQLGGLYVTAGNNYLVTSNGVSVATAFSVLGGTNYSGGFVFGEMGPVTNNTGIVNFTNAAVMYVGSGGISSNGSSTINASLNNGGLFGATADWTSSASMILNGVNSVFTFQAADADGTAHNITLNNPLSGAGSLNKKGAGTLTLNATSTYAGSTLINAGTLALGASGVITVSPIIVGSGNTFDVTAVTGGYNVNANQVLSGSGTVTGAVSVASAGIINPGSNALTGTLTFKNDVVETGGAFNHFDLSGNPAGPDNDFIVVNGSLTVSGTNTIEIGGAPQNQAVYKLFQYGTFSGDTTNFTTSGGTLSNSVANSAIYLVAYSTNHPPTNVTWLGNPTVNNWEMLTTTNWSIAGTGPATNFVTGDLARFDSVGAANPLVNIVGNVTPGSVTVDATSDYTFGGTGSINGTTGLTKTNSGTLNILTVNNYSGATVISGGVLAVTNLANGSSPSAIGSANVDPANLIIQNGTLRHEGPNVSTDRGVTLVTNTSAAIDVTNSTATLTLSGTLTGPGTLVKAGQGRLILSGANSYGSTVTSNGILQINTSISALGSGAVTFAGGGLSLNVSSQQTYNNPINVITTGTLISAGGKNNVLSGAWAGSGTLLVDVGNSTASYVTINTDMTTNFTGAIVVSNASSGFFRFNGGGGSGGAQQSTGSTTATFDLGNSSVIMINRNGGGDLYGHYSLGAFAGGTNTVLRGSANAGSASTYHIGAKNLDTTFSGKITDGTGGTAATVGITKVGTGTLTFDGGVNVDITTDGFNFYTNTAGSSTNLSYSGPTVISNGVLRLVTPVTLTNSPNGNPATTITLASPSAVLDGSVMGYYVNEYDADAITVTNVLRFTNGIYELAPNQTLRGIGTILASNVLADANSQLSPGLPLGTLNASQKIELAGAVNMSVNAIGSPNCSKIVAPNIQVDGTAVLTVTNLGPEGGATFQLFSSAVTGFASVNLPALTGTNSWVNNLAVDGSITLIAPPAVPATLPALTNAFDPASGKLTLSWGEEYKGLYRLLVQTNTTDVGLANSGWVEWTGASATNKVIITVDQTRGTVFFRLIYP